MNFALNQLYRESETLKRFPEIKKTYETFVDFAKEHQHLLETLGRNYDYAVLFHSPGLDFNGKIVADLGARNGHFGPWLTGICEHVYVSDYFQDWGTGEPGGLPDFENAKKQWVELSRDPSKITCSKENLLKLSFPDEFFDHVICTSVIEHTYTQIWDEETQQGFGDIKSMKEMARVLKPGGYLLLSTDMSADGVFDGTRWFSGTYWYTQKDIYQRLIEPSGLKVVGPVDFSFEHPHNSCIDKIKEKGPVSPCIIALQKPF
jgi:SAM-dependent methyltransferase